jgi:hypothetical protein
MNIKERLEKAVKALAAVEGCKFVSLVYKTKEKRDKAGSLIDGGEVARYTLLLGVHLDKAYKRDLALYKRKVKRLSGLAQQACQELIDSLEESLKVGIGNNSAYTGKDAYLHILDGIKIHKDTGELHLNGFRRSKVVLKPGVHKTVNSAPKTIEKNKLRRLGRLGQFRQFALVPDNLKEVKVEGRCLVVEAA